MVTPLLAHQSGGTRAPEPRTRRQTLAPDLGTGRDRQSSPWLGWRTGTHGHGRWRGLCAVCLPAQGHRQSRQQLRHHPGLLNVIGKFAYGIGTRVTADIYRNADGSLAYRLKYAFATWTPEGKSPLTFKLGQIHTPWLDWEEHLWDYRMQGQMAMERAGYLSSSDFGAGIDGMLGL